LTETLNQSILLQEGVHGKSKKQRNSYAREFKLEAMRLSEESSNPACQIVHELGIPTPLRYHWRGPYQNNNAIPLTNEIPMTVEPPEIKQLRLENARLKEEPDILKRMVGWSASDRLTDDLIKHALKKAFENRKSKAEWLFHSDQVRPYASHEIQSGFADPKTVCSMSHKKDGWANRVIESFPDSLKSEWIHHQTYRRGST